MNRIKISPHLYVSTLFKHMGNYARTNAIRGDFFNKHFFDSFYCDDYLEHLNFLWHVGGQVQQITHRVRVIAIYWYQHFQKCLSYIVIQLQRTNQRNQSIGRLKVGIGRYMNPLQGCGQNSKTLITLPSRFLVTKVMALQERFFFTSQDIRKIIELKTTFNTIIR